MDKNNDYERLFENEEFRQTLEKYEQMISTGSQEYFDADQLNDIASFYAANDRTEEAEAAIEYSLLLHPGDVDSMIFKSRNAMINGNIDEALNIAASISEQNDEEVMFLQAEINLELGNDNVAETLFKKIIKSKSKKEDLITEYHDIIETLLDYRKFEKAFTWINAALKVKKEQQLFHYKHDILITNSDYVGAEQNLEAALDEYPYNVDFWLSLAEVRSIMRKFDKAIEAIEFAKAVDPECDSDSLLGDCYYAIERWEEAEKTFTRAIERNPRDIHSMTMIGVCMFYEKKYEQGIEVLKNSVEHLDDCEEFQISLNIIQKLIYMHIAMCYHKLNDHESSDMWLDKVIETSSPDLPLDYIYILKAENFYLRNDKMGAMIYYQKALEESTTKADTTIAIFFSMLENNDTENALAMLLELPGEKNDNMYEPFLKYFVREQYGEDAVRHLSKEELSHPKETLKKLLLDNQKRIKRNKENE